MNEVPEEYLLCRLLGHSWHPEKQLHWKPSFGHGVAFMCNTCGMVRKEIINANGRIAYRGYDAPDGYRIPRDKTPDRSEIRLQFIRKYVK